MNTSLQARLKSKALRWAGELPLGLQPKSAAVRRGNTWIKVPYPARTTSTRCLASFGFESYEPETTKIFEALCRESQRFFDIGANVGIYTAFAKTVNPQVRIWAFEPEPNTFQLLRSMIAINQWQDVTAEKLALGDMNGTCAFYVSGELESSTNAQFRPNADRQTCVMRRLDSYCVGHNIDAVDLLKIDTESTEPEVLAGGAQIIGDCKPDIVCEVLRDRREGDLQAFFRKFDYRFYHLTENGPIRKTTVEGDPHYKAMNYLFTTRRSFDG